MLFLSADRVSLPPGLTLYKMTEKFASEFKNIL